LPEGFSRIADESALDSLADPRVLMSTEAMASLREVFDRTEEKEATLFEQTIQSVRDSLETGLWVLFLIGAITMLISFLVIVTVPEVSMDIEVFDKKHTVSRTKSHDL
jgi:hypothetical protein